MNVHVLEHLPLWVEGDLDAPAAAAVACHLEGCPACRAAAEALRGSQAWLKGADEAPFTAEDRAALRRAVLVQVRQETRRHPLTLLRPLILTAAAAVLVFILSTRFRTPPAVTVPETSCPVASAAPSVPVVWSPPTPSRPARTVHRPPAPDPDPIPAGSSLTRIEFQTDNPQIRIIWLAKAEPLPDPIAPNPEVP